MAMSKEWILSSGGRLGMGLNPKTLVQPMSHGSCTHAWGDEATAPGAKIHSLNNQRVMCVFIGIVGI